MMNNKRQEFSGRQKFTTSNARLCIKRKTFDDGREPVTTLQGYPMLWNDISSDRGGYSVRLLPNAARFDAPTMALFHHNFENVIGNTANQTLRILAADDIGIPVEIDLPNTSVGRDVAELVAKKYIQGMSFSMVNGFEDYDETQEDGKTIINVSRFTSDEVTVTGIPAFTGTSIDIKPGTGEDGDGDEEDETQPVPAIRIAAARELRAHALSILDLR